MIRVCHVITGLYAHGAERMLLKLIAGMDAQRFDSMVISLMDKGAVGPRIEALGVPVLTLDWPRGRPTLSGLTRLVRLVRDARPDVVQGWMYHGNLAATLAARFSRRNPPVLWNIRQSLYGLDHEKRLTRWLIRLSASLSRAPRHILYNSMTSAVQHETLGFRPDRRVFIPNGFAVDVYAPSAEGRHGFRNELGLADDELLIGMAARYHPMKDHANFLRAAALTVARRPAARFVLAGAGINAANGELGRAIAALGLTQHIHLLGERRDMPRFFQALDIAVLSSAWGEGFPNVMGEAMACGTPCVATAVGDAPGIAGRADWIVPARDPQALAERLEDLIDLDRSQRIELGRMARQRIVEQYSLPRVVSQYEALYLRCLNAGRRARAESC